MKECPCYSLFSYDQCCAPFHRGANPATALQLMRSRYAAYALRLPSYIIRTTHPDHPEFCKNKELWEQEITFFSTHTTFKGLKILHVQEEDQSATITFSAYLVQTDQDVSFTETSHFEKKKGEWLYRKGDVHKERYTFG